MTILLERFERKMPALIMRIELQMLMNLTARIFGQRGRWIWIYKPAKALKKYALYTRELLLNRPVEDDISLQQRMGEEAYKMGSLLRRMTGLSEDRDLKRLVFLLYQNIGIDMRGDVPGNIYVDKCYFSDFYDPQMCQIISGMDDGIISGLYGGGELRFMERITEGCAGCRACFKQDKDVSEWVREKRQ